MLALHVLPVCTYSAPARAYLALVCAFASLLVDRHCVLLSACGACAGPFCASALNLFARAFPVPARVPKVCPGANMSTYSIAMSFPTQ